MRILVTGGAGYVGSHAARLLSAAGHEVWIYDNLSQGHRGACPAGRLIEGELMDQALLVEVLRSRRIEAVMHFAAFALVGESVTDPAKYYQNNVVASLSLLEAMRAVDVRKIVFSSTTATYGVPEHVPITEDEKQAPINPYGFCKLVVEHALADYAHAYGFGYAALRYFNAAGASPAGDLGEDHDPESHLIPIVLCGRTGTTARDHGFWRRLSDARRDLHSRLYPRRRPWRGPSVAGIDRLEPAWDCISISAPAGAIACGK